MKLTLKLKQPNEMQKDRVHTIFEVTLDGTQYVGFLKNTDQEFTWDLVSE